MKNLFCTFLDEVPNDIKLKIKTKFQLLNTSDVKSLSKHTIESALFNHMGINGGNTSDIALKCKIKNEYFLIPPQCRYLLKILSFFVFILPVK